MRDMIELNENLIKKSNRNAQLEEELKLYRNRNKRRSRLFLFLGSFLLFSVVVFTSIRLVRLQGKYKDLRLAVVQLQQTKRGHNRLLGNAAIPSKLLNVSLGEDLGIVLDVKTINIRNVKAPYNASIVSSRSGYDLIFRYDIVDSRIKYAPYSSRIGVAHLNSQFQQGDQEFKRINLKTEYAEDPRILFVNEKLYMLYNQLDLNNWRCRYMTLAELDKHSFDVNYVTVLDANLQWIEKNWGAFEYVNENSEKSLFLEYRINPRKLFEIRDPQKNELLNVNLPSESAYQQFNWPAKWGEMRGGTPAQKIGDEYLAFFHSSFTDDNELVWYVMGAYTFKAKPPFEITRISDAPILFQGIYETPFSNTACVNKRVIFPSGFVIEKKQEQELIHLVCGENDCSVKIVTLDKEQLIKRMNCMGEYEIN